MLEFFALDTLRHAPETFTAIVAIALLAIILDAVFRRSETGGRSQTAAEQRPA